MRSPGIKNNFYHIKDIRCQIEKLSDQEEIHWKQRSRVTWLQHGDRNTRFFHISASQRKSNNFIRGLVNDRGEWCTDTHSLAATTFDYFGNIYSSSNPSVRVIEAVTKFSDCLV